MLLLPTILLTPAKIRAQGFPPISEADLKMTTEPKATGAPAIVLFREVDRDDNAQTPHEDNYIRIKILTEEGRKYGDVEIPFNKGLQSITDLHARTIEPDGSAVDFNGEIFDKLIAKFQGHQYLAKTFTMPSVQVGSVLEYRFTIDLKEHQIFSSHWIVSGPLFTRYAKFSLKPYVSTTTPVVLRWSWNSLPPGAEPKKGPDRLVRMEMQDIPAFQEEDFMPPPNELKSRVDFVYEWTYREDDPVAYWQHVGKQQYELMEKFIDKRKQMEQAVSEIVSHDDAPELKLRKIYGRVQQIRNRSYEIQRTAQETKREKEKVDENVEDVWKRGYGTHRQLTWLFLALVRAAGFDAHGVLVSSRNEYFFDPKVPAYWRLNTAVVLVASDGHDLYFDPGAEFNSFGMLTWSETGVQGLKLEKDGGSWIKTPLPEPSQSRIVHAAKLKLTEDGALEGTLTTTYTGLEAMYHRLDTRNSDDLSRKKFLENRVRSQIPVPSTATLTNSPDWGNSDAPLVAEFSVTIPGWASNAGRRTLIPAALFSAGEKRTFEHERRVHPIYFSYPYQKEDDVTIELPAGWKVSSVPQPTIKDEHIITYSAKVENNGTVLHLTRKLSIDILILGTKYYPALRNFYQGVRASDEQQIIVEPTAAAAAN